MGGRIIAADAARGLAVLGMFAAHLSVNNDGVRAPEWLALTDGRPSAAFAVLAGVSIALFTGRVAPPRGPALVRGWQRVLSRAVFIFAFGILLEMLATPIAVILPSYAVAFVFITPALGAGPRLTAGLAGLIALIGPTLMILATTERAGGSDWATAVLGESDIAYLLLTGRYAAVVWSAYLLLGLAIGRLPLGKARTQLGLGLAGALMVAGGYGLGEMLSSRLGAETAEITWRLVSVEPHADSTFELIGNAGTFLVVFAVLLWVTTSPATARAARVVLAPLLATGQLALSAYSLHIVLIAALGDDVVLSPSSNALLVVTVLVTLVVCTAWVHTVGRGPLEMLLRWLTAGGAPQKQPAPAPAPARL